MQKTLKYRPSVGHMIRLVGACGTYRNLTRNAWDAETLYNQIRNVDLLMWLWNVLYDQNVISYNQIHEMDMCYTQLSRMTDAYMSTFQGRELNRRYVRCMIFRAKYPFPKRLYNKLVAKAMRGELCGL